MTIKTIHPLFLLVLLLILVSSCSKMNDMHQMYLDEGEILYAAKLDSVASNPGKDRIEFEMFALSQRIDKVRIYWNDNNDSLDFAINNEPGIYKHIVPNIPEGEYIFTFVSFDIYNNRSLGYELTAESFGDLFASRLFNRTIQELTVDGNEATITWRAVGGSTIVETVLSYEKSDNSVGEVSVAPFDVSTTLSDIKAGGEFWYKTLFKPVENAIDIFESETYNDVFPITD